MDNRHSPPDPSRHHRSLRGSWISKLRSRAVPPQAASSRSLRAGDLAHALAAAGTRDCHDRTPRGAPHLRQVAWRSSASRGHSLRVVATARSPLRDLPIALGQIDPCSPVAVSSCSRLCAEGLIATAAWYYEQRQTIARRWPEAPASLDECPASVKSRTLTTGYSEISPSSTSAPGAPVAWVPYLWRDLEGSASLADTGRDRRGNARGPGLRYAGRRPRSADGPRCLHRRELSGAWRAPSAEDPNPFNWSELRSSCCVTRLAGASIFVLPPRHRFPPKE